MDLTAAFTAACARLREENPSLLLSEPDPRRILRSKRPKDEFESRAREVAEHVERMREFLAEHREKYLGGVAAALDPDGAVDRERIDKGEDSASP